MIELGTRPELLKLQTSARTLTLQRQSDILLHVPNTRIHMMSPDFLFQFRSDGAGQKLGSRLQRTRVLKSKYSSGDLLDGLVLGQQSHRRQNISNHTKQMLEALLGEVQGDMQRTVKSYC